MGIYLCPAKTTQHYFHDVQRLKAHYSKNSGDQLCKGYYCHQGMILHIVVTNLQKVPDLTQQVSAGYQGGD